MDFKADFYTKQFWLLCLSNFLFTASFQMLLPELPSYLTKMGGGNQIGLIIALFTLTAGFSRPFSGKVTDTIGRVPVMAFGSIVCFVAGFVYPLVTTVSGLLWLRFFHGFSTGTKPTATAAYVADIVPEDRRGEAAGMMGIFTSIGFSIGPAMGGWLVNLFTINALFYASAIFALLSILILVNMKETLPKVDKKRLSMSTFKISWIDIFEPKVILVFFVMLFISFPTGILITLVPDHTLSLGMANKGIFFTVYTVASLVVRVLFAKTSDKYGRKPVMIYTCICMVLAMVCMAYAQTILVFFIGAILFGFATGMSSPTLTAWTIDLSDEKYRGRALATMYIALEAGIGFGALAAGNIYKNNIGNLPAAYFYSAIASILALFSIFIFRKSTQQHAV